MNYHMIKNNISRMVAFMPHIGMVVSRNGVRDAADTMTPEGMGGTLERFDLGEAFVRWSNRGYPVCYTVEEFEQFIYNGSAISQALSVQLLSGKSIGNVKL